MCGPAADHLTSPLLAQFFSPESRQLLFLTTSASCGPVERSEMAKLAFLWLALLGLLCSVTSQPAGYGYGGYPIPAPSSGSGGSGSPVPVPVPAPNAGGLAVGFYGETCPNAENIVRGVVEAAVKQNPGVGAGLIRMLFHDCFVEGCDASVLLDPTTANPQPEKLSPPNFPSLRGFEVIDAAKAALEKECPGSVSCADVVAFAARDASAVLSNGRISFAIPAGRRDGTVSLFNSALQFLPPPSFNLAQLTASFAAKGLDVNDLVVLSGAHTVGRSHCSSFTRNGRLNASSSSMNPTLAASLRQQCPASPNAANDPTVNQDVVTPNVLDNQYYKNLLSGNVLFTSDAALLTSTRTNVSVMVNALSSPLFEVMFAKAMVKMAGIEAKTGTNGEIRKNCRVVN